MQAVQKPGLAAGNTATPPLAPADSTNQPRFLPATHFAGARAGFVFRLGPHGLGYYHENAYITARPSPSAKAVAVAPVNSIAAAGAAKQPTDAATQALMQTVSAIGQSAAAAMRLSMSVSSQSPAAKLATAQATAAVLPRAKPAAVHEQPSSRATAFDHSSRFAAGSSLGGHSAAGALNGAATAVPSPSPPAQQAAVGSVGIPPATVISAPSAGQQQGVLRAQTPAASAAKDLSSSGGLPRVHALTASEPAKPGKQMQLSGAAAPGLSSSARTVATSAGPTQNGDSMPPGLQPSASHMRAGSGAVVAQSAERTAAAAPSSLAAACGATAGTHPPAEQLPGLGTGKQTLAFHDDLRLSSIEAPAHPDAFQSRALEPAKASVTTSLAVACGDTTARAAEDGTRSVQATAAASLVARQRAQQRRVLDIVQGRCDRSAEDVERQRRTAITRTNDRRRVEGLEVRRGLCHPPSAPVCGPRGVKPIRTLL